MPIKVPLDKDALGAWQQRIQKARDGRQPHETDWKENTQAVRGKPLKALPSEDFINVNKDYAVVRQKMAQLFYRTPDVQLTPAELMDQTQGADAVRLFQAVLNQKLGLHEMRAKAMVERVIWNVLVCGTGPSQLGYDVTTQKTKVPAVDLTTWPPEAGPPPMVDAEIPISERWYWESFNPLHLLLPRDFTGDDFDEAPWIGMEFWKDLERGKREYNLPEDWMPTSSVAKTRLTEETPGETTDPLLHGYQIWYRASVYDLKVRNDERIRLLVIIDGWDGGAVRHEDSPHQTLNQMGQLTADSLRGYPIHPLVLNYTTDSAWPQSDCSMIRPLVNELCKSRSQMIIHRDRSIPMRIVSLSRIGGQEGLNKLLQNVYQGWVPFDDYDFNNPAMGILQLSNFPRENFTFNDYVERDLSQTLAIGPNQRGTETDVSRTATELSIMQGNLDARLASERQRVVDWFVRGVAKLGTLLQRYADRQDYVEVIGEDGVARIEQWDKRKIQGRFAYTIRPDSSIYVDATQHRKQLLEAYNYLARDPFVNRIELLRDIVRAFNMDPTRIIAGPPQGEPSSPEPNISYRFGGDDLDPRSPKSPIVIDIMRQAGVKLSAEAVTAAQQMATTGAMPSVVPGAVPGAAPSGEHPGVAENAERLTQRHAIEGEE